MRRIAIAALLVPVCGLMASPAAAALTISVAPAVLAGLAPGTTSASTPVSIVLGAGPLESWVLHVDVAAGARMTRVSSVGPCAQTENALGAPLSASFDRLLPPTTIDIAQLPLDNLSSPIVAHGTGGGTVNVVYSQTVADDEVLVAGCAYAMSVTYTASTS
jgi:hypothetical protein